MRAKAQNAKAVYYSEHKIATTKKIAREEKNGNEKSK